MGAWFFVTLIKLCKAIIYNLLLYVNLIYNVGLYELYLVFLLHCMKSLKSVLKLAPAKKKGSFEGRPEPLHGIEYFQTISKEIKPLEEIVIGFAVALKEPHSVEDQIKILKAIIPAFYDLKSKCVSLGPEYQDYFSKMWEHLHNSHCDDFCYIEKYEKELKFLLENKIELCAKEALHISESENLENRIKESLIENGPILQTELYKFFDPIIQNDISSILYFMAKNGRIKRTKQGKTYLIEYKG